MGSPMPDVPEQTWGLVDFAETMNAAGVFAVVAEALYLDEGWRDFSDAPDAQRDLYVRRAGVALGAVYGAGYTIVTKPVDPLCGFCRVPRSIHLPSELRSCDLDLADRDRR